MDDFYNIGSEKNSNLDFLIDSIKRNYNYNLDISFKILENYYITVYKNKIRLYDFLRSEIFNNIYDDDINKLTDDLKKYKGLYIDNKLYKIRSYYIYDPNTNLDKFVTVI